jgi:HEAT repeat protein
MSRRSKVGAFHSDLHVVGGTHHTNVNGENAVTDTSPEAALPAGAIEWEDPSSLPVDDVRDLFLTLSKALRSYQLYDRNNPVYRRFVGNLVEAFQRVWEGRDELQVLVEEDRLLWMGEEIYRDENRSGSLTFLLFRDGLRDLTFRRGIEGEELEELLDVLHRVRSVRQDADDLVTLLWDMDLDHLRYTAVDLLPESSFLGALPEGDLEDIDVRAILEEELGDDAPYDPEAAEAATSATILDQVRSIRTEDFNPAVYALDEAERAYLEDLFVKEVRRNPRLPVIHALFDRLEDEPKSDEREKEILAALAQLLPTFMGQGLLTDAARLVGELERVRSRANLLSPGGAKTVEEILEEFSSADSIRELIRAIESGSVEVDEGELALLLRHLRPSALGPLLAKAEEVSDDRARESIRAALRALANGQEDRVLHFLGHSDPGVVAGAVRLLGALRYRPATDRLVALLDQGPVRVRLAVLEAARRIPTTPLAEALVRTLDDENRDLRIGAARVIAEIRFMPASPYLEGILKSREMRETNVSEQLAFFSAYADLTGQEGVALLDRILHYRSFLGRREPGDLRACAAIALGRIRSPGAVTSLERARDDHDPVVRSAVRRALSEGSNRG